MPSFPSVRIGIIGMGNVGPVVGSALRAGGHDVSAVSAHSSAASERASVMLPGVEQMTPQEVVRNTDVVILAVPDRAIRPLADELSWRNGQIVVHLSGAVGLDVLSTPAASGAVVASIHPAMTFQGLSLDVSRLSDTPMAVTAPPLAQPLIEVLAAEMGGKPFILDEEAKPLYHAAMTHSANHVVTLISQARDMLLAAGVTDPAAVLGPLTQAAVEGALTEGMGALTGPVQRGDQATVAAHEQALAGKESADTYRWMSRATREEYAAWRDHETRH